jgi:hypothetical protein
MVDELVVMVAFENELVVNIVLSEELHVHTSRCHYKNDAESEYKNFNIRE